MDVSVFETVGEIKKFYDEGTQPSRGIVSLIPYKKLKFSIEQTKEGAINMRATHPLRIFTREIYNTLLRLYMITSVNLVFTFTEKGQQKSVSKRFGPNEDLNSIISDLLDLPHEKIVSMTIDTDYFKITDMPEMEDNVSVILKRGNPKTLFRSLINYMFPFVNIVIERSASGEINISKSENQVTVDLSLKVDDSPLGIKSRKFSV
jgi:hypothetical protein